MGTYFISQNRTTQLFKAVNPLPADNTDSFNSILVGSRSSYIAAIPLEPAGLPGIKPFPGGTFTLTLAGIVNISSKAKISISLARYKLTGEFIEETLSGTEVVLSSATVSCSVTAAWTIQVSEEEKLSVHLSISNSGSSQYAFNFTCNTTSFLTTPWPNLAYIKIPAGNTTARVGGSNMDAVHLEKYVTGVWTPFASVLSGSTRCFLEANASFGTHIYRARRSINNSYSGYSNTVQITKENNSVSQNLSILPDPETLMIPNPIISAGISLLIPALGVQESILNPMVTAEGAQVIVDLTIESGQIFIDLLVPHMPIYIAVPGIITNESGPIPTINVGHNISISETSVTLESNPVTLNTAVRITVPGIDILASVQDQPDVYAGSTGIVLKVYQGDYRLISTRQELESIRQNLNGHYRQISGISLDYELWDPIGTESEPFTGIYDGMGNGIFYLYSVQDEYAGLFGVAGPTSIIRNVYISEPYVIAGKALDTSTISPAARKDYAYVSIGEFRNLSDSYNLKPGIAGGLVAKSLGRLENCHISFSSMSNGLNPSRIYSNWVAGGLAGIAKDLYQCSAYATVQITGSNFLGWKAGGLCGETTGTVQDCWSGGLTALLARADSRGLEYMWDIPLIGPYHLRNFPDQTTVTAAGRTFAIEKGCVGGLIGKMSSGKVERCLALSMFPYTTSYYPSIEANILYTKFEPVFYTDPIASLQSQGVYETDKPIIVESSGALETHDRYESVSYFDYLKGNVLDFGGLIGWLLSGSVSDSYYNSDICGQTDDTKGTPMTTDQLRTVTTYNNWDFRDLWALALETKPFDSEVPNIVSVGIIIDTDKTSYRIQTGYAGHRVKWTPIDYKYKLDEWNKV